MSTYANKAQISKSQIGSNSIQEQRSTESTVQPVDSRAEPTAQEKMQDMTDGSPQVRQLSALQAMMDNNPESEQVSRLQAKADDYALKQQPLQEESNALQRRAFTPEEQEEFFGNPANPPLDTVTQFPLDADDDIVLLGGAYYSVDSIMGAAGVGGDIRMADGQPLNFHAAEIQQQVSGDQWAQIEPLLGVAAPVDDNIGLGDHAPGVPGPGSGAAPMPILAPNLGAELAEAQQILDGLPAMNPFLQDLLQNPEVAADPQLVQDIMALMNPDQQ